MHKTLATGEHVDSLQFSTTVPGTYCGTTPFSNTAVELYSYVVPVCRKLYSYQGMLQQKVTTIAKLVVYKL